MTPTLKLALLPSLLAASLVLSACNDASTTTGAEAEGNSANDPASEVVLSAMAAEATPATDNITAEQKMIDNLAHYRWTLATATDSDAQPLTSLLAIKDQVILTFGEYQGQDTVSYSVGCNTMGAAYQLQGQTITTEDSMSTKMLCDDLNVAENRLNTLMQGESQLSLAEGEPLMLTQVTSDSATLVWQGKMTSQAKYHSKGETLFWAVNSETKPCTDNSAAMCLQVRSVTYNEQGVKISEGQWANFVGDIDGYQPDGKHDDVLRLQRYKLNTNDRSDKDALGEEYAYVLDTVIESAVAK
ncbi:heat shock protein HslJ [Psychrobacter sp. PL15]|uniref:META domain-containing protein n=1 Tax=Psychrobacter sp. PL15 TaxID=3071719 RepID=UPI002E0201F2|nr:heat shock protein HslJ [Psychrobacter sp. PL15]